MANNSNLTVYQRLSRVLNGSETEQMKYVIDKNLIKDYDPEAYAREKLEAQQTLYLQGLWRKIDNELYQKAVFYEPTRIASYYDFEAMEFTPEIGAALDLYMEEACTSNENGSILQVYSESSRIKAVLEELFYDIMDINANLPSWTRNVTKYGDNFLYLKVLPKKGIVGCKQLPNIEITRVEPDFQKLTSLTDLNRETNVKFYWKNKDMEFNTFEMAHFRLLGDDRRLPYGTCLKSDSYINTDRGVKEIKDIQIDDVVLSFNTSTHNMEYSKVLDVISSGQKQTYKISSKHNFIEASEEHKIMIYNKDKGGFDYKNVLDLQINDLLVINNTANNFQYSSSNRLSDHFILEPIISIEKSDYADTYDIYVEHPEHNFIANGIVVHNSMLDKARRIWKQLVMSEDAMLTYRISRAAERRVYKVFVGNMDDKDVDAYVDKVANNFRRVPVVDSANGQIDLRYNMISVDQDIFVPLRDPALPSPIETLPGANNLDQIADIKYTQRKLLTALRIPLPFIGFEESVGDGKNLAMLDVRFARTIYRIQKALIQELNKIAIIHLHLKGFEDELGNFTLTLTNPSTQQDLLKIERWREKVLLYRDAVTSPEGGFAAMSTTKAKREILDMSDDEIKLDIQRQAVEKAAVEEMKILGETIKQTGMFKDLYSIYNIDPDNLSLPQQQGGEAGGGGGGGFGGGGGGGGLLSEPTPPMGEDEEGEIPPEGEENMPPAEGEENVLSPEEELEPLKEQLFRNGTNVHQQTKRLGERLEKRNRAINEDVRNMIRILNELEEKKTISD